MAKESIIAGTAAATAPAVWIVKDIHKIATFSRTFWKEVDDFNMGETS
ncbi:hypothetical protein RU89_GL001175 [Lactococcus cremoris]|uniref:Uncharacterized protein n=1 Tax=Lactococcus cremoris subsp. tructae TaxID=542833 RepID=A0A2A5SS83_LACLC|nr:hypothetical protein [Lactococcus cremoris]MDU1526216.1 hypothetical protein [Lactococcus lactis]PCS18037.1 hypothetical protein RU92_GL002342 [Lactococcus cremoris subsp. tructae]KZK45165.1 hypothetical protein B40_1122 [Lactococcus cremoris]MDU2186093.1 hypothetical protein [Lactococcus lactis]MDU3891207.1 hypothetical protein [Lactococcus lactis]